MKILDKYMPLKENETITSSLEGNAYNISPNIIMRILSVIEQIFALIIGAPRKVYVIVTDLRIITIETRKIFWFIDSSVQARSHTPRSISQVGYVLSRSLLFFKNHYLELSSGNTSYFVKSKGGKNKVYEVINKAALLTECTN